ncbi:hypothetical protein AAFN60_18875 [Roseibacillus persicicus]|uniref:hypothetical protein n=1 Tax=Roseibacillus persicicus TaxID=454148 RepID=UPI00398B0EAA
MIKKTRASFPEKEYFGRRLDAAFRTRSNNIRRYETRSDFGSVADFEEGKFSIEAQSAQRTKIPAATRSSLPIGAILDEIMVCSNKYTYQAAEFQNMISPSSLGRFLKSLKQ